MKIKPVRLNGSIAWLFMIGSACFALGSIPSYVRAVGASADATTYFVGSIFFTSASLLQLVQAQSPGQLDADEHTQHEHRRTVWLAWLPRENGWLAAVTQFPGTLYFNVSTFAALATNLSAAEADQQIWRPDFIGSILFLVSSFFGIRALGKAFFSVDRHSHAWWIAWLNMAGSVAFMASAIASYVIPETNDLINEPVSLAGTFLGACCFLAGAALMLPAWRADVAARSATEGRSEALD